LGTGDPFLLATPNQFRPGPPPAIDGPTYARDFAEIKTIGNPDRGPGGHRTILGCHRAELWNQAVQQLTIRNRLPIARATQAFALLDLAGADAFIAAWDAKFAYSQWRPITGIRAADSDGNPATTPDPTWTPLIVTPPFPYYPAAHAVSGGAAETVLTAMFGDHPGAFRITSATAPGVIHRYDDFHSTAREVVNARVWAASTGARPAPSAVSWANRSAGTPCAAAPPSHLARQRPALRRRPVGAGVSGTRRVRVVPWSSSNGP
jgi:hypothetical protein